MESRKTAGGGHEPDASHSISSNSLQDTGKRGGNQQAKTQSPPNLSLSVQQQARLDLGGKLLQHGNHELAVEVFRHMLGECRDDLRVWRQLARARIRQGRVDLGVAAYARSLKIDPDQPEVVNDLAWHLATDDDLDRRDPQRAGRLAERACRMVQRPRPEFLATLSVAQAAAGRNNAARGSIRKAIELLSRGVPPGDATLRKYRRRLSLYDVSEESRRPVVAALARFRVGLRSSPRWPRVLERLAWILATHPDPVMTDAVEAVSLAEKALADDQPPRAATLDALAAAYAAAGRYAKARATAEQALAVARSLGPSGYDHAALQTRLAAYRAGRPYRRPFADLSVLKTRAPENTPSRVGRTFYLLGDSLLAAGEVEFARAALYVAVHLDPQHAPARAMLGKMLARRGSVGRAAEQLRAARRYGGAEASLCAELAAVSARLEDYAAAVECFEEAIELQPGVAIFARDLARILATVDDPAIRDPQRAVRLARRAYEAADADRAEFLDTLSIALAAAGRFDEAVEAIREAVAWSPRRPNSEATPSHRGGVTITSGGCNCFSRAVATGAMPRPTPIWACCWPKSGSFPPRPNIIRRC